MKYIIGSLIIGAIIGLVFTRAMDNRCKFYESLPNTTDYQRELCEGVDIK